MERSLLYVLGLLLLTSNVGNAGVVTYNRHKLIRIVPNSNHSLSFLHQLSSVSASLRLDFWTHPTLLGRPVDVHVEPSYFPELQEVLRFNNISFRVLINDLQRIVQREHFPVLPGKPVDFDSQYHSYQEILHELGRLGRTHSNRSKLVHIGTSYEFRKIYAIEIFKNESDKKPLIFLTCGLHAREWISPATCMFIARKLLEGTQSNVTSLCNNYTWIILPVLNVDGYEYSRTTERFWRKNRSFGGRSACFGVDLNRNFNHQFGGHGTSNDPCSMLYLGRYPFSEPESYALAKYLLSRRKELKAFVDIHSYGQLFMSPWGHTRAYAPHYRNIQEPLMKKVSAAIANVHGRKFTYGPASVVIYPTTGDTTDWCYSALGIIHSYSVELRPTFEDHRGFLIPPNEIVKSGNEMLNGLVAMAHNM